MLGAADRRALCQIVTATSRCRREHPVALLAVGGPAVGQKLKIEFHSSVACAETPLGRQPRSPVVAHVAIEVPEAHVEDLCRGVQRDAEGAHAALVVAVVDGELVVVGPAGRLRHDDRDVQASVVHSVGARAHGRPAPALQHRARDLRAASAPSTAVQVA
jgi:hypothetical protein